MIIWCSLELCWAGGEFSRRGTERTEMNIWTNTLSRGSVFDSSMVSLKHTRTHLDVTVHFKSPFLTFFVLSFFTKLFCFCATFYPGLISQFSSNLHEAELVPHANECQRDTSLCNEHSNQEELLKAVLLAGLYPNLIQVHGNNRL